MELKTIVSKIKNIIESFNSDLIKQRMRKLKDRAFESTQIEEKKENKMNKNEWGKKPKECMGYIMGRRDKVRKLI